MDHFQRPRPGTDQFLRTRPAAAQPASPLLASRVQRVRRVLGFSGQLAQALYDEFTLEQALARPEPGPRATAPLAEPADPAALVEPFVGRLAGILARVVAGEALLARAAAATDGEAFQLLTRFEPELVDLQADCRTLDADAVALRERLGAAARPVPGTASLASPATPADRRPSATGPLEAPGPAPAKAAGLSGWLKRIVHEATVVAEPPPPPPPPDPALERARQAFEVAHRFLAQALAYASPRLSLVELAMKATGLPGPGKPLAQVKKELPVAIFRAKLAPDQAQWIPPLAQLFHDQPDATRRAHVVLTHWEGARSAHDEAEVLRAAVARAAAAQAAAMLRAFDLPRYQAAIHPLKHLHLSFRGLPHLSALFPPPPGAHAPQTAPLKFHA